ncbi:MAG: HD domain-containing protein [Anaerolineae bacterium]|nr:HD domain-containing protein [Anaerolineae bacterium]
MLTVKEKLPAFWELSQQTASALLAGKFSDRESLNQQIRPLLDESFIESMDKVIPGWRKIATLHKGQTALHTLLVFSLCLNLSEYTLADEQTCREIEWAAVLHDLDKNLARSDTAHPFRSAAVVARIMPELGFELLPNIHKTDLETWSKLVMAAQRSDGERMIHDHSSLKQIIDGIYKCWGKDNPATRVLKAVLLHQSLPTVKEWSNAVLLTDEELSYSLTLSDMKVLGPLMIADSDSWSIFSDVRSSYLYEVRESNRETCSKIKKING